MTLRTIILGLLATLATSQIAAQPRTTQEADKGDGPAGVVSVEAMAHGDAAIATAGRAATSQPAIIASASVTNDAGLGRAKNKAARDAWRSSISAPQASEQSSDLDEAIRRLKVMEMKLPARIAQTPKAAKQPKAAPAGSKHAVVTAKTPKAEVKTKVVKTATTKPAAVVEAVAAGLSDKELQRLAKLPDEKLGDIGELAATLKALGHNEAAFGFFKRAFDKAKQADDQAWLLLQMGMCKQASDPDKAQEFYRQVTDKYKDSSWAKVAKAQDELLEWYKTNKPRETIAIATSQPAQ